MSVDWRNFTLIFILGIILISVAAAIPLYPKSVIYNIQRSLNSGGLSQEGLYAQQGSLEWWQLALTQTYEPLSGVVNTAGILTLILAVIYGCLAVSYNLMRGKPSKENASSHEETLEEQIPVDIEPSEKRQEPLGKPVLRAKETRTDFRNYREEDTTYKSVQYYGKASKENNHNTEYSKVKPTRLKPTGWWYLVPFLFGFLGGLIGYACVKSEDSDMANSLLIFGILWSFILYFAGWAIISSILF